MKCLDDGSLDCPEKVCKDLNYKFTACQYSNTTKIEDKDDKGTTCLDTSHLDCNSLELRTCDTLGQYIYTHGVNDSSVLNFKYISFSCGEYDYSKGPNTTYFPLTSAVASSTALTASKSSSPSAASNSPSTSSTGLTAKPTSMANANQAIYTLLLAFICLMTISLSKKL